MAVYQDVKDKIDIYFGTGSIAVLFLCCFLFWCVYRQKGQTMKLYVAYIGISLAVMLNPLSLYVIDKTENMEVYERFFWLLLTPVMTAATFAWIAGKIKRITPVLVVLLLLCGSSVFTSTEYKPAENPEKISAQAIAVSEIIVRDYEGLSEHDAVMPNRQIAEEDCPRAFVTEPISEDIRMYNANILLYYVRKNFGNYNTPRIKKYASLLTMETNEVPADEILRAMRKEKCEYLVLGDWQELVGDLSGKDIAVIGQTENYRVYKYKQKLHYTVRQYADVNEFQCMCYLIECSDGGLVVVDGGRAWQSEFLVKQIQKRGGRVNAWIITHPHDDHCGVLASVLEAGWDQNGQVTIDRILLGEMDYEKIKGDKRSDTYGYLLGNLERRDNVTWLRAGDELDVIGLKMKVLHTCNDTVLRSSANIMNDGSMVFKLCAAERSMLFLGDAGDNNEELSMQIADRSQGSDIGRRIADEILEQFPDDVRSTYVQMSHHGNGSLPDYFYEAACPKVAFFDAPDWLMENRNKETGQTSYYSTPHYRELMESMGCKIISYSSEKRQVVLK